MLVAARLIVPSFLLNKRNNELQQRRRQKVPQLFGPGMSLRHLLPDGMRARIYSSNGRTFSSSPPDKVINPQHNRGSSRGKPKAVTSDGTVKVVTSVICLIEDSPSRVTTCNPK